MGITFAVPDIHGRLSLLEQALDIIMRTTMSGTVVFLGDYVDRGPHSRQVVERLMAGPPEGWRWICLQGNHEAMMLGALEEHRPVAWLERNGGGATLLSYGHAPHGRLNYEIVPKQHLDWMRSMPLLHADRHRVYVHAGLDPARSLEDQHARTCRGMQYTDADTSGYRGRHLVHGHRPASFLSCGNRTALDRSHVDPGSLAIAVFDDGRPGGPLAVHVLHESATTTRQPELVG